MQVLCPGGFGYYLSVLLIAIPRVVPMAILARCGVHVWILLLVQTVKWLLILVVSHWFFGAFQARDPGWLSSINIAGSI